MRSRGSKTLISLWGFLDICTTVAQSTSDILEPRSPYVDAFTHSRHASDVMVSWTKQAILSCTGKKPASVGHARNWVGIHHDLRLESQLPC
jgi:hypothetical protein